MKIYFPENYVMNNLKQCETVKEVGFTPYSWSHVTLPGRTLQSMYLVL